MFDRIFIPSFPNHSAQVRLHRVEHTLSNLRRLQRMKTRDEIKTLSKSQNQQHIEEFLRRTAEFWHGFEGEHRKQIQKGGKYDDLVGYLVRNRNICCHGKGKYRILDDEFLDALFATNRAQVKDSKDREKLGELCEYLKAAARAVRSDSEEIVVNGMFLSNNNEEGHVKDVIIGLYQRQNGTQVEAKFRSEIAEGFESQVQNSIENAKKAALGLLNSLASGSEEYMGQGKCLEGNLPYLDNNYGISVYMEDYPGGIPVVKGDELYASGVEGESLGLSIALGIIQRFLGYNEQEKAFAATGQISGESPYSVSGVGGIYQKVYAACVRKIPKIIVPGDYGKVPQEAINAKRYAKDQGLIQEDDIELFGVRNLLEAACAAFGLNVQMFRYSHDLIKRKLPLDAPYLKKLDDRFGPRIILSRFDDDGSDVADSVSAYYAKRWLQSNTKEREQIPVAFEIDASFQVNGMNDVVAKIMDKFECRFGNEPVPIREDAVDKYLQRQRFAVIVKNFNSKQIEFTGNILTDLDKAHVFSHNGFLNYFPGKGPQWNVILVCCESSANWFREEVEHLNGYFGQPIVSYDGRSTFLDNHITETKSSYSAILTCLEPPDNRPGIKHRRDGTPYLPLEIFFYGVEGDEAASLYVQTHVKSLNSKGEEIGGRVKLEDVLLAKFGNPIIILGDGNTGKSTLLLKIFFDTDLGKIVPFGSSKWCPCLINLGKAWSTATDVSEQHLQDKLAQKLNLRDAAHLKFEIKYTPNLVFMLDGLNEVSKIGEEDAWSTVKDLARLCKECGHRFILASRYFPRGKKVADRAFEWEQFGMAGFETEHARKMLEKVTENRSIVENIWRACKCKEEDYGIIETPMMLYLLARFAQNIDVEAMLTQTNVREAIVPGWLEKEQKRLEDSKQSSITLFPKLPVISERTTFDLHLEKRKKYVNYFAFLMASDKRVHVDKGEAISYLEKVINKYDNWLASSQNVNCDRFFVDLLENLASGSLLHMSDNDVYFIHESFRDYMAAKYLSEMDHDERLEKLEDFVAEAHNYSQLLPFAAGLMKEEGAEELVEGLLEGVEQIDVENKSKERLEYVKCIVACCRENYEISDEILDDVAMKLVSHSVKMRDLMARRTIGSLMRLLPLIRDDVGAYKNTITIMTRLTRVKQGEEELSDDITEILKLSEDKRFFYAPMTIIENLGFMNFSNEEIVSALIKYFDAPIGSWEKEIFERYPWRAVEALGALRFQDLAYAKLSEYVNSQDYGKQKLAFAWHALGALGDEKAYKYLKQHLGSGSQDLKLRLPRGLLNQAVQDLNNDGLGQVDILKNFIRDRHSEEQWFPIVLAYLANIPSQDLIADQVKRIEYRYKAARLILNSNLPEKFWPVGRYLRDYKNYFYTAWARNQASKVDRMLQQGSDLNEMLQGIPDMIPSIDKMRLKHRISTDKTLHPEKLFDLVKRCIFEGERQDTDSSIDPEGFTWPTHIILSRVLKELIMIAHKGKENRILNSLYEGAGKLLPPRDLHRPGNTYPRDLIAELGREMQSE